jgi:hypothetical protein
MKEDSEYLVVLVLLEHLHPFLVEERLLLEERWEQGTVAQP